MKENRSCYQGAYSQVRELKDTCTKMNTEYLELSISCNLWVRSLQRIILVGLVVIVDLWSRCAGCHAEDSVRAEKSISVERVRTDGLTLQKAWVRGSLRGLQRWVVSIEKSW